MIGLRGLGAGGTLAFLALFVPAALGQARQASSAAGERLFTGAIAFSAGGPACAVCHAVSSVPFPRGGTLGPELTGAFAKFGKNGLDRILATLAFPVMMPIFQSRGLTPEEQSDLEAFFEAAAANPRPMRVTAVFVSASAAGGVVLLGFIAWVWRRRTSGVRKTLLRETAGREGRRP